jgi:hypothetical protein
VGWGGVEVARKKESLAGKELTKESRKSRKLAHYVSDLRTLVNYFGKQLRIGQGLYYIGLLIRIKSAISDRENHAHDKSGITERTLRNYLRVRTFINYFARESIPAPFRIAIPYQFTMFHCTQIRLKDSLFSICFAYITEKGM